MKLISLADVPEEGVSHDPDLIKKVMVRGGEVPHLKQFARLRMAPGQVAHAHAHAGEYEIIYVEAGEGIVRIADRKSRIVKGTCVVFELREVHEITSAGPEDLVLIYFQVSV
ncbi:MAG: cupin domain-containing protein [Chloroflexi bacterium]|nr:cupin domain-containing protein [Chloroflexota bacterium]